MSNHLNIDNLLKELTSVNEAAHNLSVVSSFVSKSEDLEGVAEKVNETLEKATVLSRNTLEQLRPCVEIPKLGAPNPPHIDISGKVRLIEYNWLHIQINTLLPHCRFQTPIYLTDTVVKLLDNFANTNGKTPYYKNAMLIIDEHCNIKNRTVFDQDNKGWKAILNALKGRVFPDDDQFSVGIALVSTKSEILMSNIFVIDAVDVDDFFNLRSNGTLYW